jgi:hypothetical protein
VQLVCNKDPQLRPVCLSSLYKCVFTTAAKGSHTLTPRSGFSTGDRDPDFRSLRKHLSNTRPGGSLKAWLRGSCLECKVAIATGSMAGID